jgi:hypothetical protein
LTEKIARDTFRKVESAPRKVCRMRWIVPSAWFLGIGWYFAVCVTLGVLAGRWLDGRFGTAPWLGLVGTLLGLAMALYGGYRLLTERVLNVRSGRGPRPPGGSA